MEKSILILGASSLQVPLIKYVKQQGFNIIVASIPGNYPGFSLADKCIYCDVRDVDSIYKAIKEDQVIAVLTDETDIAVPSVAVLSEKLGLCGNSIKVAEAYANKFLMRKKCLAAGVSVPAFSHISSKEDIDKAIANISFPAIMKPEDNQGSRGVYKVFNKNEICAHIEESLSFSKTGNVIIESFFEGKEIVVEGFVYKGEYLNFGIGEREYFNIDNVLIPSQTRFPAILSQKITETLLNSERRLHAHINPSFGMIHSEYIVNEETGEYILVETALRGGGVYISSHLVPLCSGIDNYHLLLSCALGKSISIEKEAKDKLDAACAYICFSLREGIIETMSGIDDVLSLDSVVLFDNEDLKVGASVKKMINKTQRLGPIIVRAGNRSLLDAEIMKIQSLLKIEVKDFSGKISSIIW